MKTHPGRYFEDFQTGARLVHAVPRTVTEGDCALYIGLTGDRRPLHCSAEYARSLGYARETVNDLLVFHVVFGRSVNDVSLNALANLGYAGLRFLAPVYPGDTLRAESKVLGTKENRSGDTGTVWVHTVGENQRGERVLEFFRWVMVPKRDASKPTGAADQPEMPPEVKAEQLVVPGCLDLSRWEAWPSGASATWDDYAVGERIDHVDGMTIEESEHAIATRLYQNTAKVHFNALAVKETRFGRRIIYGGHVISIVRALAHNGLECATALLGFNGGAHANPTFAGDTLYAWSEVLAKAELPGRRDCGALRVRMVGVKNVDPTRESIPLRVEQAGRTGYHPNVVLDLDHWLLLPRAK